MDSEWLTYLTEDWSADFENGLRETDRGFQTSSCAWVMAFQRRLLSRPEAQMIVSRTMDHMSSRPRSCWPRGEFPGEDTLSFLWLIAFRVSIPEWGRAVRLVPADLEVAFARVPAGWPKSESFPSLEGSGRGGWPSFGCGFEAREQMHWQKYV